MSCRAAARAAWVFAALACRPSLPPSAGDALPDPVAERFEELSRRARRGGAGATLLARGGAGIAGDSLGGVVSVGAGSCALVLSAAAASVRDLDAFAFADDGEVLASDETSEKEAPLLVCPARALRAFVSVRVAAGFGVFGFEVLEVPSDAVASVSAALGLRHEESLEPGEIERGFPELAESLRAHRRRIGGDWETQSQLALPLDSSMPTRVSARVEADHCLDLLVVPPREVAHVELEVFDARGRRIGMGGSGGSKRSLVVCSPESRDLVVQGRPHTGRGIAALILSRTREPGDASLSEHARRYDVRPAGTLDQLREARAKSLEAAGYAAGKQLFRGALAPGRRRSVSVSLSRGCHRLDVVSAAPIRALEGWLWDRDGALLARAVGGATLSLFACTEANRARLDLESIARGGEVVVDARHGSELPRAAIGRRLALGRLLSRLDARGRLTGLGELPEVVATPVNSTSVSRVALSVPPNRCLELSAALDRGAAGLEVRLWRAEASQAGGDEEANSAYGPDVASVRYCALSDTGETPLTAELRVHVGSGSALWVSRVFSPAE